MSLSKILCTLPQASTPLSSCGTNCAAMEGGLLGFIQKQQPGTAASTLAAALRLPAENQTATPAAAHGAQLAADGLPTAAVLGGGGQPEHQPQRITGHQQAAHCDSAGSSERNNRSAMIHLDGRHPERDPCWHLDLRGRSAAAATQTKPSQPVMLFDDFGGVQQRGQNDMAGRGAGSWVHTAAGADGAMLQRERSADDVAQRTPPPPQLLPLNNAACGTQPSPAAPLCAESSPHLAQKKPAPLTSTCRICHRQFAADASASGGIGGGAGRSLDTDVVRALLATLQGGALASAAETPLQVRYRPALLLSCLTSYCILAAAHQGLHCGILRQTRGSRARHTAETGSVSGFRNSICM